MAITKCMGQNVTSTIGNNLGGTCMCRHMYAVFMTVLLNSLPYNATVAS